MNRQVIFDASCDRAAERLGGYQRIDLALEASYEALVANPYAFELIENDFCRARFLITDAVGGVPSLVWMFTIDTDNNVTFTYVEAHEVY